MLPHAKSYSEKMVYIEPLDEFYAQAGRELPHIEPVPGEKIPEPYKSLLVHDSDMTSTLEKFHGAKIHLKLLSRRQKGDFYFREVVLALNGDEKPVEFGAIKINLALFASEPRKQILEERFPLGHILRDCKIAHTSQPKAFFKIQSDGFINCEFGLKKSEWLFGRCNALTNPSGKMLAEIVEILPT